MISYEEIARVMRPFDPFITSKDVPFLYKVFMKHNEGVTAVKTKRRTKVAEVLADYISMNMTEISDRDSNVCKLLHILYGQKITDDMRSKFVDGDIIGVFSNKGKIMVVAGNQVIGEAG